MVLVIDELSFPNRDLQIEFARSLIQLAAYYEKQVERCNLKFVISTISEPLTIITDKAKASGHFHYLSANDWGEDMKALLTNLTAALNLNLNEESTQSILTASKNNPRLLKNILRKVMLSDSIDDLAINRSIKLALHEYF